MSNKQLKISARTAIKIPRSTDMVLIGDDTDLLVLLLNHCDSQGKDFSSPIQSQSKKQNMMLNIQKAVQKIG